MQTRSISVFWRWTLGIISVGGLLSIFLFQRHDWSSWLTGPALSRIEVFLVNRSVRFILNDIFAVMLVAALFGKRKFVVIAIYVQLAGVVLVLIPYVILKLNYPSYNGPMINFLHRLVLNPLLIYLLIFFFWYNEMYGSSQKS